MVVLNTGSLRWWVALPRGKWAKTGSDYPPDLWQKIQKLRGTLGGATGIIAQLMKENRVLKGVESEEGVKLRDQVADVSREAVAIAVEGPRFEEGRASGGGGDLHIKIEDSFLLLERH